MSRVKRRHNTRPAAIILLIPMLFGILAGAFIFSSRYQAVLSAAGAARLTTKNWQIADSAFLNNQPAYSTKFAYYRVLPGQSLSSLAAHFGVPEATLASLNPGTIVAGTTIKVPPVQQPLTPFNGPSTNLNDINVQLSGGVLYVSNRVPTNPQVQLTIPDLMQVLAPYKAISQTGPKQYRLWLPLYIQGNIRLDITGDTVSQLALKSGNDYDIAALTVQDAEALIENTTITTFNPATNQPAASFTNGRAFIRAYGDARMDILNSRLSYLGMSLGQLQNKTVAAKVPFIIQGGIYGVSWRIPTGTQGQDIATGWVQNATFDHNYIGAFTFGTSGMMWQHSVFSNNYKYGLDPHTGSSNALIEYNTFMHNGKHGFIVSKECNYNVIRDNTSYGNTLHGFMLHENSNYNLIENNLAYDNQDNYVIFNSNLNEIKGNKGYGARGSEVRINAGAQDSYIIGNTLSGGERGIYTYDNVKNVYISGNTIQHVGALLATNNAQGILFINDIVPTLAFKIKPGDRVIFGPNRIASV